MSLLNTHNINKGKQSINKQSTCQSKIGSKN
ncbi:hypothetical protein THIX_30722 [Thiomonas sp. X19]|nr:hypothetical protein THIX_30722 [Thiomonas sp. X19]